MTEKTEQFIVEVEGETEGQWVRGFKSFPTHDAAEAFVRDHLSPDPKNTRIVREVARKFVAWARFELIAFVPEEQDVCPRTSGRISSTR